MTDPIVLLAARLQRTSAYMQWACEELTESELRAQFDPEFSPIGWHLGHVAWQEELWVLRGQFGMPALYPAFDEVFDSFRPDKTRRGSALPSRGALSEYRSEVRAQVLDRLQDLVQAPESRLMQGAGLARFVANHESQHIETVLALRLAGALSLKTPNPAAPCGCDGCELQASPARSVDAYLAVSGGSFEMGSDVDPERWDNESGAHSVHVPPFRVQRRPVSNRDWLEFSRQGGYQIRSLWSEEAWSFLARTAIDAPLYWSRDRDGRVLERTLRGTRELDLEAPVSHVSWYEAQAFSKFAGARLLTEAEWEWLATQHAGGTPGVSRGATAEPCLSLAHLSPNSGGVGQGAAEVVDLTGGIWEWTSDAFLPYPGFQHQAYRGYSEPWFDGKHRVARGGAYVTEREIARATFRNWYLPGMRRAFLGLRLARDDS